MSRQEERDDTSWAIYIGQLLFKKADGQPLDDTEREDLENWRQSGPQRMELYDRSLNRHAMTQELRELDGRYDTERSRNYVFRALGISTGNSLPLQARLRRWAPAAVLIPLLGLGALFLISRYRTAFPSVRSIAVRQPDIPPGNQKAVLILSNGEKVTLDSTKNGQIAQQGNVHIINQKGQLSYAATSAGQNLAFNTVVTPRGGQYQLLLPDGSRVWLNAASSIQFPIAFTGNERKVKLTGEAYFDIAQDKSHPFIVEARDQRIAVLGTAFDVMAYDDEESQRTTLLNGAITVKQGDQNKKLAPGEQAILQTGKPIVIDLKANIEKAVAWKSGFFMFDNTDIKTLMREIARWYDIEVIFKITDYSGKYGGRISRNSSLLQLKELLEGNNIYHYTMENRKLTILP